MQIEYLFKPDQINKIIEGYTCIKEKTDNPLKEGMPSISFPSARKTSREIYRIFCSQHCSHLQELLNDLEYCLNKGWQQPTILQTRSGMEFHSAISELMVAEHFAKIGFEISSFDQKKKQESVPDLLVTNDDLSCSCEVYAPRDWDGLDYFIDDIRLSLLHLDIPWDFTFEIRMKLACNFDEKGHLRNFDPWQFSDSYIDSTRRSKIITPFIDEITVAIQRSNGNEMRKKLIDECNNTITEISVHQIEPSRYELPARKGDVFEPTLTRYAPEAMFDRLVRQRVYSKIKKGQTNTLEGTNLRALFADVSRLGYKSEFGHSYYQRKFADSVEEYFDADSLKVDMVIFFQPIRSNEIGIEVPLLFKKKAVSDDEIKLLLGKKWEANQLTNNVLVKKKN